MRMRRTHKARIQKLCATVPGGAVLHRPDDEDDLRTTGLAIYPTA